MSPGPAPTLLDDWFTWPFVAAVALVFGVWFAVFTIRAIRHDRLDAMPDPEQPEPHECNITGCHQPGTHSWPTGVTEVTYYACTGHAPMVRDWAGPYDRTVETVYDQELDGGTDLQQWEQEMTS